MALRDRAPGRWMVVLILFASLGSWSVAQLSLTKNSVASGGRVIAAEQGCPCQGSAVGLDAAEIAHARAAIERGIGVEPLPPAARGGQADPVALARHRREVADHQHRRRAGLAVAQPGEHGVLGVVGLDPREAAAVAVALMQGRQLAIDPVQVLDQQLHALVPADLEQVPVEAPARSFHSAPCANSWPMNSSFLPGWPHMKP